MKNSAKMLQQNLNWNNTTTGVLRLHVPASIEKKANYWRQERLYNVENIIQFFIKKSIEFYNNEQRIQFLIENPSILIFFGRYMF